VTNDEKEKEIRIRFYFTKTPKNRSSFDKEWIFLPYPSFCQPGGAGEDALAEKWFFKFHG
jgi:hypothetical protein